LVEQMAQVPRAVADVQLRLVEVGDLKSSAAGPGGDPERGVGEQLHEPDRSRARARVRMELRFLVDDGGKQGRIEVVVARVSADELVVPQRIAEAQVPG